MSNPRAPQKCKFCPRPAEKSLIWADGRAYVPVCGGCEDKARAHLRKQGESVVDVKKVEQRPVAYREAKQPWTGRLWDVGHYAKTLPRFEFILHFVARMTRKKKDRDLVGDMQLKRGPKGWYYTVGGLQASHPTKDEARVYDMIRRTQLNYFVQQAEELRMAAHEQAPVYREHAFLPRSRMEQACEDALAFVEDEEPGTYFGLQADPSRVDSALGEAPARPSPRAPIGRRDVPRGAVVSTRTGKDVQGVKGQPIKRSTGRRLGRGTRGVTRKVTKRDRTRQEIPDSLLQMLGSDWKTMKAQRVHDNRMNISIDGVRYTLYTRRG